MGTALVLLVLAALWKGPLTNGKGPLMHDAIARLVTAAATSNDGHWREQLAREVRERLGVADDDESDEARCVYFLVRRMPDADRGVVSAEHLARNCALALGARARNGWAASVPWPIFLEFVAPYALFDEPRDEWRPLFAELLAPLVAGSASAREAALRMNALLWRQWDPPIKFVAQQTRVGHPGQLSPLAVIKAGNASCTGLSIMLVDALRAVGVPARVVGTPVWNRPGCSHEALSDKACGNHNWVEVWLPADGAAAQAAGGWHFFGAAEGGLDEGWFYPMPAQLQVPGGLNISIYAARFGPPLSVGTASTTAFEISPPPHLHFPMVWAWDDQSVGADDVTARYLEPPVL